MQTPRDARKAEKQAEYAEQLRQLFIRSHQEAAKAWWDSGRAVYVVKLNLGGTVAGWASAVAHEGDDVSGAIEVIEAFGWRLDHIGYVYQPLKERSSVLSDSAHMSGDIMGIYTFRRPTAPPPPI